MINEQYTQHWSNGVEDLCHYDPNGVIDWERGVDTTTPKAASISMKPTRVVDDYFTTEMVLPHLKAHGADPVKHKRPVLWSQYEPREYIESDGNAYIDTGIKITSDDEVYLDGCATTSGSVFLLSQGLSANDQAYQIANTSANGLIFDIQNYIPYRVTTNVSALNTIHKIHIKNREIFVDGVSKGTSTGTLTNPTDTAKLMYSASGEAAQSARIAKFTVVGKCDLIPVRDVVNNVYGLFDRVTETFYGNAGTGAFTGGEIIQPISYAEIPSGGYLEFDVTNTQDTRWLADMKYIPSATPANYPWIGGFRTYVDGTGVAKQLIELVNSNTARLYIQYSDNDEFSTTLSAPFSSRDRHVYEFNANKVLVDGTVVETVTAETFTGTDKLKIGGARNSSGISVNFTGNCYKVQCWKDGTHQDIDAIPVRIGTTVELLDLVNWQFATRTGTFTAGADINLVPDAIKVNTGDLKYGQYGKNLFNKGAAEVLTGYVSNSGIGHETFVKSGTSERTILFKCKPSTTYTISKISTDRLRIAEFPLKPVLSSSSVTGSKLLYTDGDKTVATVTTDSNGEWLTIQVSNSALGGNQPTLQEVLDSLQVELGSTATEYEPYKFGIFTTGSHKLFVGGKNRFDIAHTVWGKNIGEDGTEASSNFSSHSDYIECKPNTTYTVSWIANTTGVITRYHEYDGNKTWLRQITTHSASSVGKWSVTFTTGATARYIRFTFRGRSASSSDLSTDIQIEEGSTATAYEPYIAPISRDIPTLYNANSYVDIQKASNNKHEEWNVRVLNGTENWSISGSYTFYMAISGMKSMSYGFGLCSHFTTRTSSSDNTHDIQFGSNNYFIYFFEKTSKPAGVTDVASWKAYLASEYAKGSPVIVLYQTSTPTVSTVEIEPISLTEKATYTITSEAELPVTEQAVYMGLGI